jgi:4-amino-4-deoxy-L-arabinose transferase-like glycosyltransferase
MLKIPKPLIVFFVCALLLRLVMLLVAFQYPERTFQPDTSSYIQPALDLLKDHAYTYSSATRTPIYPFFIAFSYIIFGQTSAGIVALQLLVSSATVLLTYLLGIRLSLSKNAAIVGSILIGVSVEAITHVFFLVTETLFSFLLLASIVAYVETWQSRRKIWLIISAILLALAVLCRPIALPLPLLLAGIFIFQKSEHWRQRLYFGFIYLLIFTVVLFPWVLRNKIMVGVPTISTITSKNMLYYNAAILEGHLKNISLEEVRAGFDNDVSRSLAEKGFKDIEATRYTEENILAQQIISQAPLDYIYLYLKSDLNNFLPGVTDLTEIFGITQGGRGTADVLNRQGLLAAINYYFADSIWMLWLFLPAIILLGITYMGDMIAVVVLFGRRQWFQLFILGIISLYFLLAPGGASLPRFRVPAIPFLSLLAGIGLEAAWQYAKQFWSNRRS